MKNNLLTRLLHQLKKLAKPVGGALLTGAIIVSTLTSCRLPDFTPSNNSSSSLSEKGEGSESTGSSSSGAEIPEGPYDFTQDEDFKNFSPSLQKVLTEKYYQDVIKWMEAQLADPTDWRTYPFISQNNYCDIIPYGFLEKQGYDIDEIKNADADACISEMYIKDSEPNNLYINCAVLNSAEDFEYYDIYLLKYTLTEKELNDLNFMFQNNKKGWSIPYYSPFFVQELSYDKTAEVVKTAYMSKNTFNKRISMAGNQLITAYEKNNNTEYSSIKNNMSCMIIPSSTERIETSEKGIFRVVPMDMFVYSTNQKHIRQKRGYIFNNVETVVKAAVYGYSDFDLNNISAFIDVDDKQVVNGGLNTDLISYRGLSIDNTIISPEPVTFYSVYDCGLYEPLNSSIYEKCPSKYNSLVSNNRDWLYEILYNKPATFIE